MFAQQTSRAALLLFLAAVWAFFAHSQECQIIVRVVAPPNTPDSALVFIAGNVPTLGNWDPSAVRLQKESDSVWSLVLKVPLAAIVEFKITRGSWNKQALFEKGAIPGNFRLEIRGDTTMTLRPVSWSDIDLRSEGGIKGLVRYHRGMKGDGLTYPRDVIVWLPSSYEREPKRRYPVLYMHDGQNVFDPATSFIGYDWHADEITDSLARAGAIEEIMIVAINNTPDRTPEYSDTQLGRSYGRFVVERLKPFIDSTYRTKREAKHTGVMGSSMGGLISFLFVWWYPHIFSKAGCLSSAFLVDNDRILHEVREDNSGMKAIRVYLDCGTVDLEARLKPGYNEMKTILEARGYKKGKDLEYFLDQGAVHNERAWAARLWRPLKFLFGK